LDKHGGPCMLVVVKRASSSMCFLSNFIGLVKRVVVKMFTFTEL
jgi:hypothetical protein